MLKSKKTRLIHTVTGLVTFIILSVVLYFTIIIPITCGIVSIFMIIELVKYSKSTKKGEIELEKFSQNFQNQNIANLYGSKIKRIKIFKTFLKIVLLILFLSVTFLPIFKAIIPLEFIPDRFYNSRAFEIIEGQYFVTSVSYSTDFIESLKLFSVTKPLFNSIITLNFSEFYRIFITKFFNVETLIVIMTAVNVVSALFNSVPVYIAQIVDEVKKTKKHKETALLYVYEVKSLNDPVFKKEHENLKDGFGHEILNLGVVFSTVFMLYRLLYIFSYIANPLTKRNPIFQTSLQFASGLTICGYIVLILIIFFIIAVIVFSIMEKSLIKKINKQYNDQINNEIEENLNSTNEQKIIIEDAQDEENLKEESKEDIEEETNLQKALKLEDEGKYEEALKFYKEASKEGIGIADYFISLMYKYGRGVEINEEQYYKYSLAGYEKGCEYSKDNLANCYEKGIGCKRNMSKARELYAELAKDGDYFSGLKVGSWYVDGINVKPNYEKALEYLNYALHSPEEDKNLGLIYHYIARAYSLKYDETKGEKGYEEMEKYLLLAIENGSKEDKEILKTCKKIHKKNVALKQKNNN